MKRLETSSDIFEKNGNPWVSEDDRLRMNSTVIRERTEPVRGLPAVGTFGYYKEMARREIIKAERTRLATVYRTEPTEPEFDSFTKAHVVSPKPLAPRVNGSRKTTPRGDCPVLYRAKKSAEIYKLLNQQKGLKT